MKKTQTTVQLLDAIKARHSLHSDYQLASYLGLSRQRVSKFRAGTDYLGDETVIKVAHALSLDAGYVAACMRVERAKCTEVKTMWRHVAEVLSRKAAAVMALAASPALLETARRLQDCILCQMDNSTLKTL